VKLVAGTGLALRAGQWLNTASAGGAELVFATGTRVQVEEDSNLGVLSQDAHQRLVLRVGRLRAQVEKLTPGERFVVELPGAEVEVKGTKFELVARRDCSEGSQAEVRVEEGVVEVRVGAMRLRLGPGQQWRAECGAAPGASEPSASAPVPSAEEHEPAEMNERSARAKPSRAPDPERGSSELGSSLPEQNALFSAATEARRRGELDTALELYSELARRFPSSALTESALLARVRLLVTRAPTRARIEARLFLERYPDSAARAELQSLLESP
jgi:TolA-binding protein